MFRATKKRSKPATSRVRLLDEEDEEERELNHLDGQKTMKSLQRKPNRTVVRSFNEGDNSEEAALVVDKTNTSKRRKKNKAGGVGFGGLAATGTNNVDDDDTCSATYYDRDALAVLLAEQKSYFKWDEPLTSEPPQFEPLRTLSLHGDDAGMNASFAFPDCLPLTADNPSRSMDAFAEILAGDEALSFIEKEQIVEDYASHDDFMNGTGMERPSTLEHQVQQQQVQEDTGTSDLWETEVTRRAGLLPPSKNKATPLTCLMPSAEESGEMAVGHSGKTLAILDQLRAQLRVTVEQLNDQQSDMERRMERRNGEIKANATTLTRHEAELQKAGSALEFYQVWRDKLCAWVGAIRELRLKVEPILVALHELEGEKSAVQRWQDWENDTIAVLEEHGMLEQVLGRQPPPAVAPVDVANVDEFGRDVKSRHAMQRDKRKIHRRRIHHQRHNRLVAGGSAWSDDENTRTLSISNSDFVRGDESDAFISDGEEETFRERHQILQEALSVAMNDVQEEYTILQNLVDLFEEWHVSYPVEYKQCFASLSLVDLAGVLVQAELCALNDPWNKSGGYNEAKWAAVVHLAMEKGTVDRVAVERLLRNWVLPAISDLLGQSGINLTSSRQTRSLSTFISRIQKLLPADDSVWAKLRGLLGSFASQTFTDIAIPTVRKAAHSPKSISAQEDIEEACYAATWGQLYRIKKLLENLLLYWAPIMQNDPVFCDSVLHFISNKLVFLLSSLQGTNHDDLAESPADVFRAVYQGLLRTDWLELPEYMLEATLIRAAAAVYQ